MAFENLTERLQNVFKNLRGKKKITETDVTEITKEIRVALLEADVALPVVKKFIKAIRERAVGVEVSEALNPAQQVIKIVDEELTAILGGGEAELLKSPKIPTIIMMVGLQGAGKTTFAALVPGPRRSSRLCRSRSAIESVDSPIRAGLARDRETAEYVFSDRDSSRRSTQTTASRTDSSRTGDSSARRRSA